MRKVQCSHVSRLFDTILEIIERHLLSTPITLYGTPTCPELPPVRGLLGQAKIPYNYIDITRDPTAAARVRAINDGNESVPTLVFPDGTSLTEPSTGQIKQKLERLGYRVGLLAWLIGNAWRVVTGGVILYALLRFFEVL